MSDVKNSSEITDRQALVGRYQELAELAGSLAHEIKNPLSVIRMNMDLLAEDLGNATPPASQRAMTKVEVVQNQCTRLENLLNDFLKFTRLQELDLVAGNLNDQVNRVLDLFTPQANNAEVEIVRYLDPDLPSVQLNSQTLQAALINLVKMRWKLCPAAAS